jgi:hypothetical protein
MNRSDQIFSDPADSVTHPVLDGVPDNAGKR